MIYILYFIFGILFIEMIFPLIGSLMDLIQCKIEEIKSRISINIVSNNKEVEKKMAVEEEEHTNAIGFSADWTEEEDEECDNE